jgi:tRNA (guanine37-N1)-methyltransferase
VADDVRIDIITLFPAYFEPLTTQGVVRRAFELGRITLKLWPLRDFADDAYRRVDDRPFGGGPGMVMMAEPLERALAEVRADRADPPDAAPVPVLLFSPAGERLSQSEVERWAGSLGGIWICGRYEGIDQRFIDRHVTQELSLGDFVLSGGEVPAMALLDSISRLMPGVLNDPESHQQDSFSSGLLDCPHYTRPEHLTRADGSQAAVPPVLMSGNHAAIAQWRREQALALTWQRRPDLLHAAAAAGQLSAKDHRALDRLSATGDPTAPGESASDPR